MLTAALGAALVTGVGVAGGSAAAAAEQHTRSATTTDRRRAGARRPGRGGVLPDRRRPPGRPPHGRRTARAVAVTAEAPPAGDGCQPADGAAAWVNPNPTAVVTSCFGPRWGRLHAGVDLAAADGTPIVAAGAGVVVRAGVAEGYGNAVLIDHGNGFLTHYGHLSAITVTVGPARRGRSSRSATRARPATPPGRTCTSRCTRASTRTRSSRPQWMHEHGVDIPGCVTFAK